MARPVVSFPFSFQFFTRLAAEANVPDPKGRHGKRPCRAQLLHCLVAGRTPLGERIWDMQRLLDWACKLPQVDPQRILMTGNSPVAGCSQLTRPRSTSGSPSLSQAVLSRRSPAKKAFSSIAIVVSCLACETGVTGKKSGDS